MYKLEISMNFVEKKIHFFLSVLFGIYFFSATSLAAKIPDKPHGELPSDYWQFWFLYEKETRPGQAYQFFRPFYSEFKEYETAYRQKTILFPFYYGEETNYWYTWSILFLFTGTGFYHEDSGEDTDLLIPFFFLGSGTQEKDHYWGVFPFYGKLKGKLSYEEVQFVVFPLYTDWRRRNYKARGIVWPFVMWGSSDTRHDIRIFPFFSKKEHKGKYYQYSLLWPFFQWGRKFMDKREPVSYGVFFPFYLYKDSDYGNMKSRGYFWFPFLGSLVGYGYDQRNSETDLNLLFFLIQFGKNNDMDYRKLILFPFYGHYQFASKKSTFITPFYFKIATDTYHVKSETYYYVPFFFHNHSKYSELHRESTYWKIWPLFRYENDIEGSIGMNLFTLFPVPFRELDATWDPIISIFEYKNNTNGEKQLSLLFRFYTQRWSENQFAIYIPFLSDLEITKDSLKWNFFYGLLGYEKKDETKYFRVFWFLNI